MTKDEFQAAFTAASAGMDGDTPVVFSTVSALAANSNCHEIATVEAEKGDIRYIPAPPVVITPPQIAIKFG